MPDIRTILSEYDLTEIHDYYGTRPTEVNDELEWSVDQNILIMIQYQNEQFYVKRIQFSGVYYTDNHTVFAYNEYDQPRLLVLSNHLRKY